MITASHLQVRPRNPLRDTDASVNIVHCNIFKHIQKEDNNIQLSPAKAKICDYGSKDRIERAGQFTTFIRSTTGRNTEPTFYVAKGQNKCILGFQSSTELGLLTLSVNSMAIEHENPTIAKILQQQHQQLSKDW